MTWMVQRYHHTAAITEGTSSKLHEGLNYRILDVLFSTIGMYTRGELELVVEFRLLELQSYIKRK